MMESSSAVESPNPSPWPKQISNCCGFRGPETEPHPRPGMRLIVPLQGVVQGRGGLLFGSLIPCALFYFLQFYLKRNRTSNSSLDPPSLRGSSSNLTWLQHTLSRSYLSRAGSLGRIPVSSLANSLAEPNDSPYYIGLEKVSKDRYNRMNNPNGIIQLGLCENRLCLYLIEKWISEHSDQSLEMISL